MTTKRPRTPRPKHPSKIPLDEGSTDAPEAWRKIDGVQFCHLDRWLLRLSLEEPDGLASITREFKRRAQSSRGDREIAEAMIAQLADLGARLTQLAR